MDFDHDLVNMDNIDINNNLDDMNDITVESNQQSTSQQLDATETDRRNQENRRDQNVMPELSDGGSQQNGSRISIQQDRQTVITRPRTFGRNLNNETSTRSKRRQSLPLTTSRSSENTQANRRNSATDSQQRGRQRRTSEPIPETQRRQRRNRRSPFQNEGNRNLIQQSRNRRGTLLPNSRSTRATNGASFVENQGDDTPNVLSMIEYRNRKEIGIAIVYLGKPLIELYQFVDKAAYSDTMSLITQKRPKQILFPSITSKTKSGLIEALNDNDVGIEICNTRQLARKYFNDNQGRNFLQEICTKKSLSEVNISDDSQFLALSACSAAISWLNYSGPQFSNKTVDLKYLKLDGYMKLDFDTIKNLELVANLKNPKSKKGTLLKTLDFCVTKMGKRLLRCSLFQPLSDRKNIEDRQNVVQIFGNNESLYFSIRNILKNFHDLDSINNTLSRTPKNDSNKINPQTAIKFIDAVVRLQQNLKSLQILSNIINDYYDDNQEMKNSVLMTQWKNQFKEQSYNMIYRRIQRSINSEHDYSPKTSIYGQKIAISKVIKTGLCGDLDSSKKLYFDMEKSIKDTFNKYKQHRESNIPGMKLHHTSSRGYHIIIPLTQKNRLQQGDNNNLFVEIHVKKKNIYCTTSALKTLNISANNTFNDIMKYSQISLNQLLMELQEKITSLHILSEHISCLDMILSFVTYCKQCGTITTKPAIVRHSDGPIVFKNSLHPILEQISNHKIIGNDISIRSSRNIQIINGPNGSGKSTYIKQTALLCIMSHIGCFVPADFGSTLLLDQIFSRLSNCDNLQMNQSSFLNECKDINYILNNCSRKTLVIIDELGRSTASIDAYSFVWSCLEVLKKKGAYTLMATHFNFKKFIDLYPNTIGAKFKMKIQENKIEYLYKLYFDDDQKQQNQRQENDNNSVKDYGIIMAEMTGFPQNIIKDARNALNKIKSQDFDYNTLPQSHFEMALIMKEHTDTIRANQDLTREQQINILVAFENALRETF